MVRIRPQTLNPLSIPSAWTTALDVLTPATKLWSWMERPQKVRYLSQIRRDWIRTWTSLIDNTRSANFIRERSLYASDQVKSRLGWMNYQAHCQRCKVAGLGRPDQEKRSNKLALLSLQKKIIWDTKKLGGGWINPLSSWIRYLHSPLQYRPS